MATERELLLRAPAAHAELNRINTQNQAIFRRINYAIDQILHPKTNPSPGASDLVSSHINATPAQGLARMDTAGEQR